jgi:hypothetical protein
MASEALNWALANGMTQAEFDRNIFNAVLDAQQKGTSNAMLRIEMDRLGISPADVARATGVTTQSVASQYTTAVPTTEAELIANAAADAELAARTARDKTASQALIDARRLEATTSAGTLTAAQLAAANAAQLDLVRRQNEAALLLQQRNAEAARLAELARLAALQKTGTTGTGGVTSGTGGVTGGTGGVTGGVTGGTGGAAGGTGLLGPTGSMSITGTTPFANATQGFAQNFANYQSIPIGAQYNPNVVGGAGSPYAQVMGQMRPVGNPYAGVVAGQAMGGYNPGLYDQIAAANLANTATTQEAARLAAATQTGLEQSSTGGMAQGGMVHGGLMFGANPPGPDDGAVNLDMGEYVIKKSSVNKYGRGLLDMINEGKVSAKKMKSLLG